MHGRSLNSRTLEYVFAGMPTQEQMQQLAALPQTRRITRYTGDLPWPYPDDR